MEMPADVQEDFDAWREELGKQVENDEGYLLDYYSIRTFGGEVKKGEITRIPTQFTITLKTRDEWDEFLRAFTGTQAQRGRGISSPMADTALSLLLSVITEYGVENVAEKLVAMLNSQRNVSRIIENVQSLIKELEKFEMD